MTKIQKAELCLDASPAGKIEKSGKDQWALWLEREEKSIAKHRKILRLERSLEPRRLMLVDFRRATAEMEKSIRIDERKIARMKARLER